MPYVGSLRIPTVPSVISRSAGVIAKRARYVVVYFVRRACHYIRLRLGIPQEQDIRNPVGRQRSPQRSHIDSVMGVPLSTAPPRHPHAEATPKPTKEAATGCTILPSPVACPSTPW